MAHEITVRADGTAEAAFAVKPAWHGLGVVFDHPMKSAEALAGAHLNWLVLQREVACIVPETVQTAWGAVEQYRYEKIKGTLANCRSDDGAVLGVVSDQYQVVQNVEAFRFLDELIDNHEMEYESAFSLQGGKKVVLLARLPKTDEIVPGDVTLRYLLLSLHHDGSGAIRFGPCAERVVCANTYAVALDEGGIKEYDNLDKDFFRSAKGRELSITHKGDMEAKLAQARSILTQANEGFDRYADKARTLAAHKMSPEEWDTYLDIMCPVPDKRDPDWTEQREERIKKTREDIAMKYLLDECQRVDGMERTAWAAFNAVTQHIDHLPRRGATMQAKAEARFNVAMYGAGRDMKERAFLTAYRFAEPKAILEQAIENTPTSAA
jgi:phage/plasmid-like protein (TIGR03299 family)